MIWYLLYPIRGTTEAPDLSPTHPVRVAFTRYGRYIARNVVATLLISGLLTTILVYPIPFLFTSDYINGASNLPHHVWTAAQPLPDNVSIEPDVIMRSIWIHADYMQALDVGVLAAALDIQDQLLGPTERFDPVKSRGVALQEAGRLPMATSQRDALHIANGVTNQSWFFHSPLLYWGCSKRQIMSDKDIISTVNDNKNQSTSENVTLRHSTVFSGKQFEDRRLLAADALVITLLHLPDSPIGRQWEQIAPLLPGKVGRGWDIYPSDGHITESQLYEFQFRPISLYDILSLTIAYGLTLVYFLASLTKLRAIKSKTGLAITVATQIAISIMTSFTVCAIFDIDLSRIPRASYPLVVLAMSLENMFRLINAVILTPSEDRSSSRVGQAFGQTGHTALTSTVQNVAILIGLSRIVSPGVSSFCVFAAIAIVFDFFYLSTFFLSVLSVDVRRMELGDALSKASMRHNHNLCDVGPKPSWFSRAWKKKVALSTRIAGTIVMIGFVLAAQWHFFGYHTILDAGARMLGASDLFENQAPSSLEVIHQARSPASWLRLQDHETAQEVIRAVKPSAYKYVARVFDPLVFVLKNSDRTPPLRAQRFLPAVYDFVHHQMAQFIATIVLVAACLCLLTNYLLWSDEDGDNDAEVMDESPVLSIKTLSGGHTLDVAMLASSPAGHLISAGLDRKIWVWDVRPGGTHYAIPGTEVLDGCGLFPVLGLAVDDDAKQLAVLSSNRVRIWDLAEYTWNEPLEVEQSYQKPELFCFHPTSTKAIPKLIIVRQNGILTELPGEASKTRDDFTVCPDPVLYARSLLCKTTSGSSHLREMKVLLVSDKGRVFVASRSASSTWQYMGLPLNDLGDTTLHQVVPLSPMPSFLVGAVAAVYLVSAEDGSVQHTFSTEPMLSRSIRCIYSCARQMAQGNGSGLTSLNIGYSTRNRDSVLLGYSPAQGADAICANAPSASAGGQWCAWEEAIETKKRVNNPGIWDMVQNGSIVGIRRIVTTANETRPGLRHRGNGTTGTAARVSKHWQVWTTLASERLDLDETRPLLIDGDDMASLVISELGPKAKVGLKSVAVAFGNVIKVITTGGQERYDSDGETLSEPLLQVGNRRRRHGRSSM